MNPFDFPGSPRRGDAHRGDAHHPWARFSSWLECVCVVTFDLELGQAIEMVFPHDVKLTEKEKSSICYLSFPDSYSGGLGDTQFSFRLRQSVGRRAWRLREDIYNRDAPPTLQVLTHRHTHIPGHLQCPQPPHGPPASTFPPSLHKGPQPPQGCPKSSAGANVPLGQTGSHWGRPTPTGADRLPLGRTGSHWGRPTPTGADRLPLGQTGSHWGRPASPWKHARVRIPSRTDQSGGSPVRQTGQQVLPAPTVLPSVHELDLFRCFQPVLVHLHMLWELMLLGEPLVVMAPSPTVSSETVLALISIISPLRTCCDFRPYFTVHDSEFREFTTRTQAPPSVVLGVTNPFFIKTFQNWPHIVRLGETKMAGDLPKQVKVKKLSKLKTLDTKPGIYTAFKTFLHKDKILIKRLLKGIQRKRPPEVQTSILRQHLLELTQSFINPLERYMASLMPLQRSVTPWKTPPQIRPFSREDFLSTLDLAGPPLTSGLKGDWTGLYRKFFRSPNFDGWYRHRHKEMTQKLESLHLVALGDADLMSWTREKSEVEIVDFILKLREKLNKARRQQLQVKDGVLEKLETSIAAAVGLLPAALQPLFP
ncbi:protein DENND6B-like [Etheostoma cragini]|uniref:protein DENND6B-like n=1 Tax=Etheostoma cragini TaxID=417921 RepID=UPI00155F2971|nr:protein DENND6B-like [Etheostoma cragini]